MQKESPMKRIWEFGEKEHARLVKSIMTAVLGVFGGMLPYFAAAQIVIALIQGNQDRKFYAGWCIAALAGYLLRSVLYTLALSMSHKAAFSILKTIREKMIGKLSRMPLGTVIDTPSGQMKQTIVDQVDSMETTLAHILPEMTSNMLVPLCIFVYLFVLDWRMALLSLVSLPIGMLLMGLVMKDYAKTYAGAVKTSAEMNSTIVEYIGGIEVIKAFNQGKNSYVKFSEKVLANAAYYYHWMKSSQLPMSLARAIFPTTMITILPVGWILYRGGSLSMETFVTTIILSLGIAGPLIAAMSFMDSLARIGTIVGSVDAILLGEEQEHGNTPIKIPNTEIGLKGVSFGYHEEEEILHDIGFTIPEGTMTALVGESGGGKSTIAKLIAGFWDVKKGSITIGGIDLKRIPLTQLYDEVAFVSQDNYLFDETIRENIRMGKPNATDEEVEVVAKAAGCDEFIRGLERGYDTPAGGGGVHLSGGERQRIAIARAMLKDAPIIIFDEATAYIDPENESVIQKAVARLIAGKTVIVIAHRLSTITDADQIVVIEKGSVADVGTHEYLLKNSPLYKRMWLAHMGAFDETKDTGGDREEGQGREAENYA